MGSCRTQQCNRDLGSELKASKKKNKQEKKNKRHSIQSMTQIDAKPSLAAAPLAKSIRHSMPQEELEKQLDKGGSKNTESDYEDSLYISRCETNGQDQTVTSHQSPHEKRKRQYKNRMKQTYEKEIIARQDAQKQMDQQKLKEQIENELIRKMALKLDQEKQKIKQQYEDEHDKMQLMLKIQAKQIEILKVEKSQVDLDSQHNYDQGSYGYNLDSVDGQSRNHYGSGDTGGPDHQTAKTKNEADNLRISNLRFPSQNFQTEIAGNTSFMQKIRDTKIEIDDMPIEVNYNTQPSTQDNHNPHTKSYAKQQSIKRKKNVQQQLDPQFQKEIEKYLKGCVNNNETIIDMTDALIQDYGAKLVATTAQLCSEIEIIKLQQCNLSDVGAIELFMELQGNENLRLIDLSYNPITEKSFDSLVELLTENKEVVVDLSMNGLQKDADLSKIKQFTQPNEKDEVRLFIANDFIFDS